ncbi:hypothetical protein D3C81_842300 [compost metagenome]
MLGILHRIHQLQRHQLAGHPGAAVRLVQIDLQTPHVAQQVAVHPLDMALVQLLGIQRAPGGLRRGLQQRLVDLHAAQLVDRQVQGVADHLQAQPCQVLQLAGHRLHRSAGRTQRALVEVAGTGLRQLGWRMPIAHLGDQHAGLGHLGQDALQPARQATVPGHEQQQSQSIEQGVEQRQLEHDATAQAKTGRCQPGQGRQRAEQQQGQHRAGAVEQYMGDGQPLASPRPAERAEHRRDGAADIGADGQGKGLLETDLPRRQRGQGQHQAGVAGLHQRGHQHADAGEQHGAEQAGHLDLRGVQPLAGIEEAGLHQVDAEEQEAHGEQHPADTPGARAVEAEQDAEHRQRQGQRADAGVLPGQRQQPDAAGGAEVGTEDDAQPSRQANQPGTQKGDGQQRDQRAGLHHDRGEDAEAQAFPGPVGGLAEEALQLAAGQQAQPLLQALHAEQEQGQPTGQPRPPRTEPE